MNKGISLICACKNRLNALKISLASWLENKNIQEIIIVDWSSDLPIQDNITLDSRIKIIRVEGQTYFNQPQPLNLALKLCTYDTVIKVDCDYIFNTYEGFNFFEKYNIDDYCFICGETDELDSPADPCFKYLRGLLYIKKKFLEEVGGWNENFREYYGGEDDEIESRLVYYGLKKKKIKLDYTLIHIPHSSKERIANFEGHNLLESKEKLRTILINNHLAHNPLSNIPLTEIEWGWETNTKALSELSAIYNILNNNIQNYYIPSLTKWNISQTSSQLFTAQIVVNKLEGFPTIYCASLEESIDRREKLNMQFAEYGLKPKYLLSKRYHECDDNIIGASLFSVDDKIKGCAVSHLKIIKEWYDTTNEEYGFFCEDDLSLETVKYWNFTFQEFINQLPTDWEAVQMCIIRDTFEEIKLRKRQLDDWAVTAYIIKREYAKKIIDYYIIQSKNITESIPSQQESIAYKLEVNGWPQVQPLVEHIILLNTGIVYCFPLFIENINNPTTSSEFQAPNHITSANFIKDWWKTKGMFLNIDQNFKQTPKKLMEHFYHNIGENWFDYQDLYSQMVNHFSDKAHFVEVGSWKGRSTAYMAVEIINSQKHIKFDCIDTWEGSEEHINPQSLAFNPELLEDKNWLYKLFLTNISSTNHIINPIRTTSLEASKLYPNRSLDFVFIDASHDYDSVKADIEAWYPKVKIGGYIGGHDYPFWEGVKKAVDEFLQQDFIKKENITINNISTWLYKK